MKYRGFLIAGLLVLAIISGCSLVGKKKKPAPVPSQVAAAEPEPSATPTPSATINITYARPNDTLKALTVTQFNGATVLLKEPQRDGKSASVVRFDGGAPIWSILADRSVLNPLSVLGSKKEYRPAKIEYAKVPHGYRQDVPDEGPPAPLESGTYYVFKIERTSGATNYEVIRVQPDGTVEGYDAEPRAGTSYSLCCNVPQSFLELNPTPDLDLFGP